MKKTKQKPKKSSTALASDFKKARNICEKELKKPQVLAVFQRLKDK